MYFNARCSSLQLFSKSISKLTQSATFSLILFFALGSFSGFGQIQQRGTATTGTSTSASVTVIKPTGVVEGDIMIANIANYCNGCSQVSASLSGWSLISATNIERGGASLLWKRATASEPASYTFAVTSGATLASGGIVAFSGVDNSNPLNPFDVNPSATWTTAMNQIINNIPSITTVTNGAAVLVFGASSRITSTTNANFTSWMVTSPTLTELFDVGNNAANSVAVGGAWGIRSTNGPTGSGVFTCTPNTNPRLMGGIMITLRPFCVNAGPALNAICQGGTSAALGGSVQGSATGTWSANVAGGSFSPNATSLNATYTPPSSYTGTVTLTLTSSGGSCGTATASKTLTVTAPNAATISYAGSPFCRSLTAGQSVTRTGTSGGTYTASPAGLTINASTGAITPSTSTAGTYTVTYTMAAAGGCSATTATTTVTVTPINTVTSASSTPTLCINTALTNITLTTTGATGIGTATGLPAGVTAAWSSNTITISGTPTASGTFNYSIPLTGGCGSVNATGAITVNTTPNPSAPASQSFCSGATVADLVATGTGLQWYPSASGAAQLASTTVLSTGMYFVTQNGTCGESAGSLVPAGLSAFGGGNSTTLNRGVVFNLNSAAILNSFQVESNDAGSVTFTLTNTGSNPTFSKTITVNLVSGSNTINVNSWGQIPVGTDYKLLWTASSNTNLDLTRTEDFYSFPISFALGSITGNNETNSSRYHYFYNLVFQAPRAGAPVSVTLNSVPTVSAATSASPICLGNSLNLSSSVAFNNPNNTIAFNGFESGNSWGYTTNGAGTFENGSSGNGDRPASTSFVSAGTNSFMANNEEAIVTTSTITGLSGYTNKVLTLKLAAFSLGSTSNGMDASDIVSLEVSLDNGLSYSSEIVISGATANNAHWGFSTGTGTATVTYDGNNTPSTFSPAGSGARTTDGFSTLTLNLPNSAQQVRVRITLRNNNDAEAWLIDDLSLTGIPATTYAWSSNPSWFTSSIQNPTATPTASTVYTVTATNAYGCAASANTSVTVSELTPLSNLATTDFVWKGSSSTDYATTSNWMTYNGTNLVQATTLPSSTNNVIIPTAQTCVVNMPQTNAVISLVANALTIESGATLTVNTGILTAYDNVTTNGTLSFDNAINAGKLVVRNGDFTMNGVFNPGKGTVEMYNNTNHDHALFNSSTSNNTFYNLYVTGDVASPFDLHLSNNINVTNDLSIQSQKIDLSGFGIDLQTTGQLVFNASEENDVEHSYEDQLSAGNGYIQATRVIGANQTVNPGNLGLEITTVPGKPMGSTVVRRYHKTQNLGISPAGGTIKSVARSFDVTPTFNGNTAGYGNTLDVSLKFKYFGSLLNYASLPNTVEPDLVVYRRTGTNPWEELSGVVNTTNDYVTISGIQHFSEITLAPSSMTVLPVELTSFTAVCEEGKGVNVAWTTASEHNSSHFDVLKSDDGYNWRSIATIAAAGNATNTINYGIVDAEKANGVSYYKLMQYDIDGESKEYGPISSDCNHLEEMLVKTFPNPSGDEFYVELISPEATSTNITIVDAQGKSVYTRTVQTEKGTNLYTFEMLNILPGMYYIQISNDLTTPNVVKHSFR